MEESTKPQIMLHSPLVSTTAIRVFFFVPVSLCKTLEKDLGLSSFLYALSDEIYMEKEAGTGMPCQRPWTINQRK